MNPRSSPEVIAGLSNIGHISMCLYGACALNTMTKKEMEHITSTCSCSRVGKNEDRTRESGGNRAKMQTLTREIQTFMFESSQINLFYKLKANKMQR